MILRVRLRSVRLDSGAVARWVLPTLLSATAGSVDVVSFLALGLFSAHITGNLVLLAVHFVSGSTAMLAPLLSVPAFIVVLALTRLLAAGLEAIGLGTLRPLLLLQVVLLAGFLGFYGAAGARLDSNAGNAVVAALLAVSAMAVQNALVQISLEGAPSTAVMTTDITRLAMDVGEMVLGRDRASAARAAGRAGRTWPAIVGFATGAALGAACFVLSARWSPALPAGLALLALVVGLAAQPVRSRPN